MVQRVGFEPTCPREHGVTVRLAADCRSLLILLRDLALTVTRLAFAASVTTLTASIAILTDNLAHILLIVMMMDPRNTTGLR
jgi:hypothetical protein